MDLLSNFQFFATADKAAQAPEAVEFKGLSHQSRAFSSLMQVPSGPAEAAPQTIGQRLVLPGDAGNALPPGGESLPPAAVGVNGVLSAAGQPRATAGPHLHPVVNFEAAPGFFGKDRVEAFAAPDRRADAPADIPDHWSMRSDNSREESVNADPQARQLAAARERVDRLPTTNGVDGRDSAEIALESLVRTGPAPGKAVDTGDVFPTPAIEDSRQAAGLTERARVDEGKNILARFAGEQSPAHGAGLSIDDFPRSSGEVLPGATGRYPNPGLESPPAGGAGNDVGKQQVAPITRPDPGQSEQADSGKVPVLRRRVRIQAPQGVLDTRVELARTPMNYSAATGPVRPPETGDPSATRRAQALVDAMPRIRMHSRIMTARPETAGATISTSEWRPGETDAHHRATALPGQTVSASGEPRRPGDSAVRPEVLKATGAAADLSRRAPVSGQQARPETLSALAGSAVNVQQAGRPDTPEFPAQANSIAERAAPAEAIARPAPDAAAAKMVRLAQQGRPDSVEGNTRPETPGNSRLIAESHGGSVLSGRTAQMPPPDLSPLAFRLAEAQAGTRLDPVPGTPGLAARLGESSGKSERALPAGAPRFVTEQGTVIESVRIATTDSLFGAGTTPASGSAGAAESVTNQFRMSPAPGTERWNQALGERVLLMVRGEQQVARLLLNPEHLGALEVQVRVQDEQAQVWLQAQSPQAREALENALPRLREMLAEQGLDLARDSGSEQRRAYERAQDSQRRGDSDNWQQAAPDDKSGKDQGNRRGGHDGLIDRYI